MFWGESPKGSIMNGNVEKSRQPAPRLRQTSQRRSLPAVALAQAGSYFAVLTCKVYAPRVKMAAALLGEPFGKTQGMLF